MTSDFLPLFQKIFTSLIRVLSAVLIKKIQDFQGLSASKTMCTTSRSQWNGWSKYYPNSGLTKSTLTANDSIFEQTVLALDIFIVKVEKNCDHQFSKKDVNTNNYRLIYHCQE